MYGAGRVDRRRRLGAYSQLHGQVDATKLQELEASRLSLAEMKSALKKPKCSQGK
jgi:hypothetical protein